MGAGESSEDKYIKHDNDDAGSDASLSDDERFSAACRSISNECANQAYASILFRGSDQIYILWGDSELRSIAKSVIDQHWGIQSYKDKSSHIAYLKLKGFPFDRSKIGNDKALLLRIAAADILRELLSAGWMLIACSNLTRTSSVGTWFFSKLARVDRPPPGAYGLFAVLSISSSDEINLANVDDELAEHLVQVITDSYAPGVQDVSSKGNMCKNIKLKGRPWSGSGESKAEGRLTIMALMAALEQKRFKFYGTSDMKGTADTMYFYPDEDFGADFNSIPLSSYVLITLDDSDDMRIFNGSDGLISEISQSAIRPCWTQGIQHSGKSSHGEGYQFKMKGKPWLSEGENSVAARHVITRLFDVMSIHGYEHYATIDMSRKLTDKSSFIFRTAPKSKPVMVHACISLSSSDKMRLISFPPNHSLESNMKDVITRSWAKGIQEIRTIADATEFKLGGSPWVDSFSWKSASSAKILMTDVLCMLESQGWQLISAADVSAKYYADKYSHYPIDVDAWILGRPEYESAGLQITVDAPPAYEDTLGDN